MENGISVRKRGNFRAILYIVQMIKTMDFLNANRGRRP